jgi:hypothetical protein
LRLRLRLSKNRLLAPTGAATKVRLRLRLRLSKTRLLASTAATSPTAATSSVAMLLLQRMRPESWLMLRLRPATVARLVRRLLLLPEDGWAFAPATATAPSTILLLLRRIILLRILLLTAPAAFGLATAAAAIHTAAIPTSATSTTAAISTATAAISTATATESRHTRTPSLPGI